jgi:hypothetical protein
MSRKSGLVRTKVRTNLPTVKGVWACALKSIFSDAKIAHTMLTLAERPAEGVHGKWNRLSAGHSIDRVEFFLQKRIYARLLDFFTGRRERSCLH